MKYFLVINTIFLCLVFTDPILAQDELEKTPIIEGAVGAGFMATEQFFISSSVIKPTFTIIPTGIVHLRFGDGKMLRPELRIEESGGFLFDRNGIGNGKKTLSYGSYYFKLPLGIPVPFFTYPSAMSLDAIYSVLRNNFKTNERVVINNAIRNSDEYFNAISTTILARLYLNTPIVERSNIFEYSYFGVYYSERTYPRTVTPGTETQNVNLFVDTNSRSGGIFFDMQKDTVLKGFNVGVAAYIGYAEMEVRNSASIVGAKYGNLSGMLSILVRGVLSYRYVFNNNLGLKLAAGVEYYSDFEFFNVADLKRYNVNLQGELKYFANIVFVFGC